MCQRLSRLAAATLQESRPRRHDRLDSAIEVRGALGEMAILLLAQRYALREVGCEEWLPLQSTFSEDNGGDCLGDSGDFAWDLNIFTPSEDNGLPDKTYNLQIKNFNDETGDPPLGPTLYINPDLVLRPDDSWVYGKIIAACDFEAQSPGGSERLTRELNARTERLLNVLEA
jgi:hypothetical protein